MYSSGQQYLISGVTCEDGNYVEGSPIDRDSSQSNCEDGTTYGCTAYSWISFTTSDNACCGNEGTSDTFSGRSEESNKLCFEGNVKTCVDTTSEAYYNTSDYYFCVESEWKTSVDAADSCEKACLNESEIWTGTECCGNLIDTEGELQDVTGIFEDSDIYRDGDFGCYEGTVHECTGSTDTCFSLDLELPALLNDSWCLSGTQWSTAENSLETCPGACTTLNFDYLDTGCCGNDAGEKVGNPLLEDCSDFEGGTEICGSDNKCGKVTGVSTYEYLIPGTTCGKYICSQSNWEKCEVVTTDYCNPVDLDNDNYYDKFCDNYTGTWNITSSMTDFCETSCEQMNGIWTDQNTLLGDDQNCCSPQDTGTWCYASPTTGKVTNCSLGIATDCRAHCDISATIVDDSKDYICTPTYDLDCTSVACGVNDCDCLKGKTTGCYLDPICSTSNCESYNIDAGEIIYFNSTTNPEDTQNGGNFAGICCESAACPY
ncbi:hypothetical protein KAT92_05205, partial [Candidatus Babeliales bacterium]|nr:hypothetical protein [Candidatus Babeliales bacterium]